MKVDYHVHLEEGPYSLSFAERSLKAMAHFNSSSMNHHTIEWLKQSLEKMSRRLEESEYSSWWLDFYLQEAIAKGVKQVGIVDHLYRFSEAKDYFMRFMDTVSDDIGKMQREWLETVMVRKMDDFVSFINRSKEHWASHGVELKLGIEADYFAGGEDELKGILEQYEFDYIIGSVHFHEGWGFDNPALQHLFLQCDLQKLYRDHFATVMNAAKSGIFDIIAHLDNIKVFNYRPPEDKLLNIYKEVARTLVKHDVATEVNPGLFYRYPVKEMCPSPVFLRILTHAGVKFTMSSDSHFPDDVGIYGDTIRNALLRLGVNEIAAFDSRKRIMIDL